MAIKFKKVNFFYNLGTQIEQQALFDIDLQIPNNQITAIIGDTGSGKSTLIQNINGLLLPSSGEIQIDDFIVNQQTKEKDLISLRANVGIVFQRPENQLFAPTVLADVAYGPTNFGFSADQVTQNSRKALKQVGLTKNIWNQSPLELSGGQMRRVAIAGVLSSNPNTIIFDEPTAGLDPQASQMIINLLVELKQAGKTIILVTHNMQQVLEVADFVVVMQKGRVKKIGTPFAVFKDKSSGVQAPIIYQISNKLKLKTEIRTFDQLGAAIAKGSNNE